MEDILFNVVTKNIEWSLRMFQVHGAEAVMEWLRHLEILGIYSIFK